LAQQLCLFVLHALSLGTHPDRNRIIVSQAEKSRLRNDSYGIEIPPLLPQVAELVRKPMMSVKASLFWQEVK
jgi:hypothetical protein